MDLKQKIINGISWNIASSIVTQILNLATKIIIARLLFPADFGLFAMAFLLINFLSLFVGFGIMSALIYKKDEEEKTFNTAFFLSILIGIFLFFASFFSSSYIATFFQQPVLKQMIEVLSFVFLFDSISSILNGCLVKNLEFKKKTIAEICSILCYSIIVIGLALAGKGVWSIVIAYLIQHALLMIFLFSASQKKPKIRLHKDIAKELLHFGKYVFSTTCLAWAITSIDNILVGKKLGDESLGYYSFGFNIAALPVLSITGMFTAVFHPVYAKLQDDAERLKTAYVKPLEWSLLFILPISVGMFLLADIFVRVLFGEKWVAMIPLLKIFAVYSIFRTVCTIISQLLEGVGKPKVASMLLVIELSVLIILIIPAILSYGIIGAALAVVIARGISMMLHLFQIKRIVVIQFREYWYFLSKKCIGAIIMGIVLLFFRHLFTANTLFHLIILVSIGIITYVAFLFIMERRIFEEAYALLRGKQEGAQ